MFFSQYLLQAAKAKLPLTKIMRYTLTTKRICWWVPILNEATPITRTTVTVALHTILYKAIMGSNYKINDHNLSNYFVPAIHSRTRVQTRLASD